MQNNFSVLPVEFEYHATANGLIVALACNAVAAVSRPVQISSFIAYQRCARTAPVRRVSDKGVQHGLRATGIEPEDGAAANGICIRATQVAPIGCRAIQVARFVLNHCSEGIFSVSLTRKVITDALQPARVYLVNSPPVKRPARMTPAYGFDPSAFRDPRK